MRTVGAALGAVAGIILYAVPGQADLDLRQCTLAVEPRFEGRPPLLAEPPEATAASARMVAELRIPLRDGSRLDVALEPIESRYWRWTRDPADEDDWPDSLSVSITLPLKPQPHPARLGPAGR